MKQIPAILVSNDDGIDAPGIRALARALSAVGTVTVVAPDQQQSAVGHALTVSLPLRAVRQYHNGAFFGWGVSGTPADCVKLAVKRLVDVKPDIVVSGINHGRNTAVSLLYSGTVSAATEGTLLGVPSIAVSLDNFALDADFEYAGRVAANMVRHVLANGLPRGVLLNVNVPDLPSELVRGVRIAPQGESYWDDDYEERKDPMGRPYYWLTGVNVLLGPDYSDEQLLSDGYVTVTPVHYRLTDNAMMRELSGWNIEIDGSIDDRPTLETTFDQSVKPHQNGDAPT